VLFPQPCRTPAQHPAAAARFAAPFAVTALLVPGRVISVQHVQRRVDEAASQHQEELTRMEERRAALAARAPRPAQRGSNSYDNFRWFVRRQTAGESRRRCGRVRVV
jgi:hypothetical protein